MTASANPAIWWIRRDLRLADNQALTAALERSTRILPLFILDPVLLASRFAGPKRLDFLFEGLRNLDKELRERDGRLIIRTGKPVEVLEKLAAESKAVGIFAEADYSPYARKRDAGVLASLPLELTEGVVVHPPGSVLKRDGDPYTVFTPFSKAWKTLPRPERADILATPQAIRTPADIESEEIPDTREQMDGALFQPGSDQAKARLNAFVSGSHPPIYTYGKRRDLIDTAGTSRLSPYLRFGMVSAREAVVTTQEAAVEAPDREARRGAESWLNELIWREFYVHILYHFPKVRGRNFRSDYDNIQWSNREEDFRAWCEGRTGYPIVDAPMRQLLQDGWMHNRARMIVASFLVKDLLVDWRWGEKWFMRHLVDGDPAANNGGWQWVAGTGTDAAPYFRIFNPVLQGKKFDPHGRFIRSWLPELNEVPDKFIHAPWEMSKDEQIAVGCIIGKDYPPPIIDHAFARERTLNAFNLVRGTQ